MVEEINFMDTPGGYGAVAVKAVELLRSKNAPNQKFAWDQAASIILDAKSSKEKGCPKAAFLGLCEEGLIKGVKPGSYCTSSENKSYALKAIQALRKNPDLRFDANNLWTEVLRLSGKNISHNHQMEVVIALWNRNLIDIE